MTIPDSQAALATFLRPLARIILTAGFSHREVAEILKLTMVEIASQEYGIRGRPTNIARIAAMTGITRKEVRRSRNRLEHRDVDDNVPPPPIAILLENWKSDANFLDSDGAPADLPFDGNGKSFVALASQGAGDVPPGALRTELMRVGCIEELPNGDLRIVADWIERRGRVVEQLENTLSPILENIGLALRASEEGGTQTAHRKVASATVNSEDLERLQTMWAKRVDELVGSFQSVMEAYELLLRNDAGRKKSVDVTVAAFLSTGSLAVKTAKHRHTE